MPVTTAVLRELLKRWGSKFTVRYLLLLHLAYLFAGMREVGAQPFEGWGHEVAATKQPRTKSAAGPQARIWRGHTRQNRL